MGDTNEYTVHDLVRDELYKIWMLNMEIYSESVTGSRKYHRRSDSGAAQNGERDCVCKLEGVSGWCKG